MSTFPHLRRSVLSPATPAAANVAAFEAERPQPSTAVDASGPAASWLGRYTAPAAQPQPGEQKASTNQATARAYQEAVGRLAAACGPHFVAQTNSVGAALLVPEVDRQGRPVTRDGKAVLVPVASSIYTEWPSVGLATLRDTAICLGLLPRASVGQVQRLVRLYNNITVTPDEKREALGRLRTRLYADEAQAWADDFEQEVRRRSPGLYAVVGEAFTVAPVAVAA